MNRLDEARRTVVIDMSHLSMLSLFGGWLQFRPTVTLCHLTKTPPPTVFFPMISVGSQVVEAQDLELLDELYPWIERSRLDQRADAESLLCLCQRSNRQNCRVYWDIKPGRC